jgi:chromatin remodeling complex protein RSC6
MPPTKKRTKKSAVSTETPTPTTSTSVSESVASVDPVVTAPVVSTDDDVNVSAADSLNVEFAELLASLNGLKGTVATLSTKLRALQKRTEKEMKTAMKTKRKRGPLSANGQPRKPSGFVKPTDITPELAKFLGKAKGVMMARTEVTREINKYIREHKLQDPANGRKINPDAPLRKLLKVKTTEELTYFNLQRYMSPHFVKSSPTTTSETSA